MAYYDDFFGDSNFQDAKEFLIEDYVYEYERDQEQTVTMTRREWIDLYYSCAQAEMMWRTRSNNAVSYLTYDITPEDHEVECRAEMKKYRILQKQLGEKMNY